MSGRERAGGSWEEGVTRRAELATSVDSGSGGGCGIGGEEGGAMAGSGEAAGTEEGGSGGTEVARGAAGAGVERAVGVVGGAGGKGRWRAEGYGAAER